MDCEPTGVHGISEAPYIDKSFPAWAKGRQRADRHLRPVSVQIGTTTVATPCFSSHDIASVPPGITQAIIVVHGTERAAGRSFATMRKAARAALGTSRPVLIIAPNFLAKGDTAPASAAVWQPHGWKQGDPSLDLPGHPAGVSSFSIIDALIERIADAMGDGLRMVTVAGHSAGAQFVQRYAAGTSMTEFLADRGIEARFIVANPSSYMYLNASRPFDAAPPEVLGLHCRRYNRYKYGLERLNPYLAAVGDDMIRERYRRQNVTYLIGEADCLPSGHHLDRTCPARMQGAHRLERAQMFMRHLVQVYGSEIAARHRLVVAPGIGHDARALYSSPTGLDTLFGSAPPIV